MNYQNYGSLFFLLLFCLLTTSANGAEQSASLANSASVSVIPPESKDTVTKDTVTAIELGPRTQPVLNLCGPDSQLQLVVTAELEGGRRKDVTRETIFQVVPARLLEIDATGLARPLSDGQGQIIADYQGQLSTIDVQVEDFAATRTVDFENQVVPLFTKLSCNGGGCHGKATGQNGFKLSLLGFYPEDDYEYLVKEGRGRRIFPAAPEKSLLLLKATGDIPHGGGMRMKQDSQEYRTLLRWIEQGVPRDAESRSEVVRIHCEPKNAVLSSRESQQITVHAEYSDGRREDVTRMTLFESNEPSLAECSETGLVTAHDLSGEAAIMTRYQGLVATFRVTIPLSAEIANLPPVKNVVDEAVFHKLKSLGIPPSELCDDATFLRRVSIDITGQLPTARQAQDFLADASPEKRERLVDELLASPEYADLFANKWNMILRNKGEKPFEREMTYGFHQWIWNSLYENKPYDQFVRDIITATGDPQWNPPVTWYREVVGEEALAEDAAQLFLGIRIQCARCHHHPYDRWSQEDYYGLAAFFSRVGKKELSGALPKGAKDRSLFHSDGVAQLPHPRTKKPIHPTGLGGASLEIPSDQDPRLALADWMTTPDNHYFARSLINRYWKHFFNRGIVEPEDDLRDTNPPSNPELFRALEEHFVQSGYDLKELIRTICLSSTYQLSSDPNEYNLKDNQNFSRYYPRRLTAESLYDAFHQVTKTNPELPGLPVGSRALQIPDASVAPYFLRVFGQPQGDSACECERSQSANLAQSLHLLNSREVLSKINSPAGRAHGLAKESERSHTEKMKELYLWVFTREPDQDELETALSYLAKHNDNPQGAYEDIVWALINTKEFLFNH
ncbi:MAG TPA: DUF1549 and DUF1553 domain-containing protein [Planctomicrobium sp.]|nr:DUF1549 and DUF1553 domain-containing protein [Planctomicrobium sp.]